MRYCIFIALFAHLIFAGSAQAAIFGGFRQVDVGVTTTAFFYPDPFDTWVFDLTNTGPSPVEALSLHFEGTFLNTGDTTFRDQPANATIFGFQAPETFFVAPRPFLQVISSVDNEMTLMGQFVPEGAPLLEASETKPVAFFSVPWGVSLNAANFIMGQAGVDGQVEQISYFIDTSPVALDFVFNDVLLGSSISYQFEAADPDDPPSALEWSNLQFSGAPLGGGSGVPFLQPTLSSSGLFEWNTIGSSRGVYTAQATVTDPAGLSDIATLTIITVVPEPSACILCALAVAGLSGLIRRRD